MDTKLGDLAKELDGLVSELAFVVMPVKVVPASDGPDVDVGLDDLPLADFVRVAHQAGVRLLYRVVPAFDPAAFAASLPETDQKEQQADRARLVRRARGHGNEFLEVDACRVDLR